MRCLFTIMVAFMITCPSTAQSMAETRLPEVTVEEARRVGGYIQQVVPEIPECNQYHFNIVINRKGRDPMILVNRGPGLSMSNLEKIQTVRPGDTLYYEEIKAMGCPGMDPNTWARLPDHYNHSFVVKQ